MHQDEQHGPLAGFTVGVTAARRAEEFGALLERRGATVLHAPALRIVPLADDGELLAATRPIVESAPDVVVATTAVGFRGWIEAAADWGLGERLLAAMGGAELLARGPKVKGAVRAAGLTETWSPASESMPEVLERLLDEGVAGRRIALQLHGEPLPGFIESLRAAWRRGPRRTCLPLDGPRGHRPARPAARHHPRPRPGRPHLHQRPGRRLAARPGRETRAAPGAPERAARRRPRGLRGTGHRPAVAGPGHRYRPAGTFPDRPARPADLPGTPRQGSRRCRSPGTGSRSGAMP